MNYVLVDIGSSTLKAYLYNGKETKLLLEKSIHFKNNFQNGDISKQDKTKLIKLIKKLKQKYSQAVFLTFATSVFRNLAPAKKVLLIEEFYAETSVILNIINQTVESLYLQIASTTNYQTEEKLMLMNIGGGSTKLIILKNNLVVERKNIQIGVGTIIKKFPPINNQISGVPIKQVVNFVQRKLPELKNKPKIIFYTGGELKYMKLTKYPLKENYLFKDKHHPNLMHFDDFKQKNKEIFNKIKLTELESLMPENPKWMHGARSCSALAQAICNQYKIKTIVPSNVNLIDGVIYYLSK